MSAVEFTIAGREITSFRGTVSVESFAHLEVTFEAPAARDFSGRYVGPWVPVVTVRLHGVTDDDLGAVIRLREIVAPAVVMVAGTG